MIILGTVPKWCEYVKNDLDYQKRTDVVLFDENHVLPKEVQLEIEKTNQRPHDCVGDDGKDALERSFICPDCRSGDIEELFANHKNSYRYICKNCRNVWFGNEGRKVSREGTEVYCQQCGGYLGQFKYEKLYMCEKCQTLSFYPRIVQKRITEYKGEVQS